MILVCSRVEDRPSPSTRGIKYVCERCNVEVWVSDPYSDLSPFVIVICMVCFDRLLAQASQEALQQYCGGSLN